MDFNGAPDSSHSWDPAIDQESRRIATPFWEQNLAPRSGYLPAGLSTSIYDMSSSGLPHAGGIPAYPQITNVQSYPQLPNDAPPGRPSQMPAPAIDTAAGFTNTLSGMQNYASSLRNNNITHLPTFSAEPAVNPWAAYPVPAGQKSVTVPSIPSKLASSYDPFRVARTEGYSKNPVVEFLVKPAPVPTSSTGGTSDSANYLSSAEVSVPGGSARGYYLMQCVAEINRHPELYSTPSRNQMTDFAGVAPNSFNLPSSGNGLSYRRPATGDFLTECLAEVASHPELHTTPPLTKGHQWTDFAGGVSNVVNRPIPVNGYLQGGSARGNYLMQCVTEVKNHPELYGLSTTRGIATNDYVPNRKVENKFISDSFGLDDIFSLPDWTFSNLVTDHGFDPNEYVLSPNVGRAVPDIVGASQRPTKGLERLRTLLGDAKINIAGQSSTVNQSQQGTGVGRAKPRGQSTRAKPTGSRGVKPVLETVAEQNELEELVAPACSGDQRTAGTNSTDEVDFRQQFSDQALKRQRKRGTAGKGTRELIPAPSVALAPPPPPTFDLDLGFLTKLSDVNQDSSKKAKTAPQESYSQGSGSGLSRPSNQYDDGPGSDARRARQFRGFSGLGSGKRTSTHHYAINPETGLSIIDELTNQASDRKRKLKAPTEEIEQAPESKRSKGEAATVAVPPSQPAEDVPAPKRGSRRKDAVGEERRKPAPRTKSNREEGDYKPAPPDRRRPVKSTPRKPTTRLDEHKSMGLTGSDLVLTGQSLPCKGNPDLDGELGDKVQAHV